MNSDYFNQIKSWCDCNQQVIENNRQLTSSVLTLSNYNCSVTDSQTAAKAFEMITGSEVDEKKVLHTVPTCKGHPNPDWKLGTAFIYPYNDTGWLFVFEKDNSIGFLDKNLFSVTSSKPAREDSGKKRNNLVFRISLLVLALIIFSIVIAIANS